MCARVQSKAYYGNITHNPKSPKVEIHKLLQYVT